VSKSWINAINRGGQWKIKGSTYRLFVSMEEVVRQHYRTDTCSCTDGTKHKVLGNVLADYSVLSSWSALDLNLEEETEKSLLRMIAGLCITIRGFSFVSGGALQNLKLYIVNDFYNY